MLKSNGWIIVLAMLVLCMVSSCSKEKPLKVKQDLAARVKDIKLTTKDMEWRLEQLPPQQQDDYEGTEGKARFVDKLIDEFLIYNEALEKKLHLDKDVQRRIEYSRVSAIFMEYYSREIIEKVEVSEDEINEYYEENKEMFKTQSNIRVQHIFSRDSMKAVEWKKRLDAGEKFSKIAKQESEDYTSALNYGDLGHFNPGGYIKFVGVSKPFSDAVEKLEVGEISDVIKFEKGFSIVRVNEKYPAGYRSLEEARVKIEPELQSDKVVKAMRSELVRLRKKYKPENYVREKLSSITPSPKQIWERAQIEQDPQKRIQFYRNIVNMYPDHEYAPEALFMIGFVYAEEVSDASFARRSFEELLDKYPDSDVVESAKWMIKNLGKSHPEMESIESVKEKIEKEKQLEKKDEK